METKVKLQVQGLTNSPIDHSTYTLILAETNGERHISMTVGIAEAQAIAVALEQLTPPRPLTHDLIYSLLKNYRVRLVEVYIYKCVDGIYYSDLLLEKDGKQSHLDSRTSDAVAVALRVDCDIYVNETILQDCGLEISANPFMIGEMDDDDDDDDDDDEDDDDDDEDDDEDEDEDEDEEDDFILKDMEPEDIKSNLLLKKWLASQRESDLRYRMEKAVATENYEHAQMYNDELLRRARKNGEKSS
ncbi:MAG: bifunctional nuclease family protein [Tannerellaceae bacterium]|nr:bifunctional nuclease family protein [Tannerellaceae bacterium]